MTPVWLIRGYQGGKSNRLFRLSTHYTLRQICKEKDTILAYKLADSVINNKTNDFWSSVKKIKGFQSVSVNCIDNVVGGENISNYFANKYSELYNSVCYEKLDMQTLVYHMNNLVSKQCNPKNCNF